MRQLREFAQHAGQFDKLNARLVAITVDPPEKTRETWERITDKRFTILSDPERSIITQYGLLHKQRGGPDIAIRATLILDENSVERWREVSATVGQIPKAEDVLQQLRELKPQ
jgi:peroxiredoxin